MSVRVSGAPVGGVWRGRDPDRPARCPAHPAGPGRQRRGARVGRADRMRPTCPRSSSIRPWPAQYPRARLVGRWVPLAIDGPSPTDLADASISAQPDPGTEITVGARPAGPDDTGRLPAAARHRQPTPWLARGGRGRARAGPGRRRPGRAGGQSRGALINRPRREIAPVASAATPIAMSLRSAGGRARTADRN